MEDMADEQDQAEQFDAFDEDLDGDPGQASTGADLDDMPPDTQWGAEAYGAGGTEAQDSVAGRAARENPDRLTPAEKIARGLFEPGDPLGDDDEAEMVGELDPDAEGSMSAEESAVHVVDAAEATRHSGLDPDGPDHDGYYR